MGETARGRVLTLGLIVSVATLALPGAQAAPQHRCFGRAATIVGTPGHDSLPGTEGPDVIVGLGGNDFIGGRGGADRICGGAGDDAADAEGGTDAPGLDGGPGEDLIRGGPGVDDLNGGPVESGRSAGADLLRGGKGSDNLCDNWCFRFLADAETGGGPDDLLIGGEGHDLLITTGGNDYSDAGLGDDTVGGGFVDTPPSELVPRGRDRYLGRAGQDTISARDGVSGNDRVDAGLHRDRCSVDPGDTVRSCDP